MFKGATWKQSTHNLAGSANCDKQSLVDRFSGFLHKDTSTSLLRHISNLSLKDIMGGSVLAIYEGFMFNVIYNIPGWVSSGPLAQINGYFSAVSLPETIVIGAAVAPVAGVVAGKRAAIIKTDSVRQGILAAMFADTFATLDAGIGAGVVYEILEPAANPGWSVAIWSFLIGSAVLINGAAVWLTRYL